MLRAFLEMCGKEVVVTAMKLSMVVAMTTAKDCKQSTCVTVILCKVVFAS